MNNALDGILVVSIEQAVAAPYAASRLADAGARVIKIERPEGDFARGYDRTARNQSAYFVWLNRGKESIALDFKAPDDRDLLHRLIGQADVFIQNLAPGAAARAGFGSAELRKKHPRLITCDISGYGDSGPYRDMRAYDLLVQAESGLCEVTGTPDGPGRVGVSVCDIACGMASHAAILEALYHRERSGEGRAINASLFAGMADWMNVPYLQEVYGGKAPERAGLHHPSIAPYGAYGTDDGKEVVIAIQNQREWRRLCDDVLQKPGLADHLDFHDNVARVDNRPALDREIDAVFTALTRDEIVARLLDAKIAYGAVNSVADFAAHPQLQKVEVETPEGTVVMIAPPARIDDTDPQLGPVPALDEHGTAIRVEFAS
ncbi:MAG: CoA transferase [Rhodospirillaceae bacterium]|jgi:crotonobetainyl-CoA:carnitine CoA-transferase CaiB-like acyl-CoA transferase|nr:CoA transferase [Rhodospirillaceae bacterium]MBT3809545.1 CoA transferase [Rhodospirillaceae bacterium]MBT3931526.1 CoA transferase [Rhodospirillaceae bacterium]MBT5357720.1 CoA transferase [Rhodospirillaceae bacterium]MBT5768162.1 CoA transferase [Rhodospirillaceae bacterium]